jgi:subtilase-type serine protease
MMTSNTPRRRLLAGSALFALSMAAVATPAQAVVPNEDKTPADIVDNADRFRGVGVVVTNVVGQGGVGICTGTLINPRTVLFAAHCVNTRPETAYDGTTVRAAVSFNVNALPGIQSWFANSRTNTALSVFNVNRILWDARSVQNPQAAGFIEADIALASLDTPAVGIPTWALLFSTLPAPTTSDPVLGTGYHVDIVGYGRSGNAIQGAVLGVDWRRRAAENMLGGYMSLDDRNAFLFGPAAPNLPQNLYHVDFDSQRRQSVFDINVHRDDARPNEGITAGGDSGGPLILNAARNAITNEDLVIGVLSGGSRFFGPQAFSSLGTTSFYQPLSLFWQYIAANNPYRYVGTRAGNGNWEDANHWVSLLDPAYRVINANGQIVNGIPTTPELGLGGTGGDWGAVCVEFESPADECINLGNGQIFGTGPTGGPEYADFAGSANLVGEAGDTVAAIGEAAGAAGELIAENVAAPAEIVLIETGTATAAGTGLLRGAEDIAIRGELALLPIAEDTAINGTAELSENAPQTTAPVLPAPTIANGLPGATGFIANNIEAVNNANPALAVNPRYFDVTLSQNGTTTLSSAVTIDRLTVRGNAGLTVAANGNLTSLIDINQFGGRVNVNGTVRSIGDYTLFAGMLEGTGTINAPFLTSITGIFSPATMGTTGTLTINGNLIMSSGTTYLADFTGAGASDRIVVNGAASVGGLVGLGGGLTQQVNGQGRRYTILTATGGVTGTFANTTISPILSQTFIYQPTAVLMEIRAASYNTVIDRTDPVQQAYAQLFDQNRSNAALAGLYGLDFSTVDSIRSTFSNAAPVTEQAVRSMSSQTINLLQNFNDQRMREADRSKAGGKIAMTGAPLNVLQAGLSPIGQPLGANVMGLQSGTEETQMTEANLPEDVAIFLAGGLVSGNVDSMPGFREQTDVSGFYVAGGLEFFLGEESMLGLSGYFNSLEADTPLGERVDSDTYAASLYMRHKFSGGPVIDGQFSLGSMGFDTRRQVQFLTGFQQLTASSDDLLISGALGLSYDLESSIGTFSPGIEARYASVDLATVREDGGTMGLAIAREKFKSTQARAGFDYEKQGKAVQINANAQLVWEFEDGPQLLGANFAQGIGPNANFVLGQADHTWVELGLSASVNEGPFQFGVGFDTTVGRSTADARVWRTSATYRF